MNGKGDKPRPVDRAKYESHYDRIFRKPMTTHVILTTYNRPEYYAELVPLLLEMPGVEVHVYNDGSDVPYPKIHGVASYRMCSHYGRERYRQLVVFAMKRATASAWDRLAMIPDDVLPAVPNPFTAAEEILQKIPDEKAMLLGMLVDKRGHKWQWRGKLPEHTIPEAWNTDWNDLCFYADERIRQVLPRGLGVPHPLAMGSGTGALWTRHLRPHGTLYCVDKTLWKHRPGPSVMCPMERKIHPL